MNSSSDFEFSSIKKAETLEEVYLSFDQKLILDPSSEFYVERKDHQLNRLFFDLKMSQDHMHAFLCGHRGSGKTTELLRMCKDKSINEKYHTVYLTAQEFGNETVHLTHDAILVEIGRKLIAEKKITGLDSAYELKLESWGAKVAKTFIRDEHIKQEGGLNPKLWFAYYKAILGTRREWKVEEKRLFEPQIQDLIEILNLMAQDIKNKTKKKLLVIVDDLEKGESEAHIKMHERIFQENLDTLIQPNFSIIYTLPVYFRGLEGDRTEPYRYAFSAVRIYEQKHKKSENPPLNHELIGYKLMRSFIEKRVADCSNIFESDGALDEILKIGGGLFRETARAVREAAYISISSGTEKIGMNEIRQVFNELKKVYQPVIRGNAVKILKEVLETSKGWVTGIEPFLQSRAVVEYENGELWIDLRYVLKSYVKGLKTDE